MRRILESWARWRVNQYRKKGGKEGALYPADFFHGLFERRRSIINKTYCWLKRRFSVLYVYKPSAFTILQMWKWTNNFFFLFLLKFYFFIFKRKQSSARAAWILCIYTGIHGYIDYETFRTLEFLRAHSTKRCYSRRREGSRGPWKKKQTKKTNNMWKIFFFKVCKNSLPFELFSIEFFLIS